MPRGPPMSWLSSWYCMKSAGSESGCACGDWPPWLRAGVASHGAHSSQHAGRSHASGAPVLRYANGTKRGNSASVCAMKHARTPRASGSACASDAQTRRTQCRQVRVSTVQCLHAHMRAHAPALPRGACMDYALGFEISRLQPQKTWRFLTILVLNTHVRSCLI